MGNFFSLKSIRFTVTCSVVVLTISSIIGGTLYLRNIRPTLYGLSGSSGNPELLNQYMKRLKEDFLVHGPDLNIESSLFEKTPATDADTDMEMEMDVKHKKTFVDADSVILDMKEKFKEPYGTPPGPNLKIESPKPPTVDEKLENLEAIPQVVDGRVEIIFVEEYTIQGGWFSSNHYVKIFKVNNLYKKKGLQATVILYTTTSPLPSLVENFETAEKLKEFIANFPPSSTKELYHQILDQQYELLQSETTTAASKFTTYFKNILKKENQPSLLCQIKELIKSDVGSHIAVLMNNRVNTILKSVTLDSKKSC